MYLELLKYKKISTERKDGHLRRNDVLVMKKYDKVCIWIAKSISEMFGTIYTNGKKDGCHVGHLQIPMVNNSI